MRNFILLIVFILCSCSKLFNDKPYDPGAPTTPINKDIPFICDGAYFVKMADLNVDGFEGKFLTITNDYKIYSLESDNLSKFDCNSLQVVSTRKINTKITYFFGYASLPNNRFWLLYNTYYPNNSKVPNYPLLSLIDSTGEINKTYDFQLDRKSTFPASISATSGDGCVLACQGFDNANNRKSWIYNFDMNGNIIWVKEFLFEGNISKVIELKSKEFLFCRDLWTSKDGVYQTQLSKLDKNGNLKWQRLLSNSGNLSLKKAMNLIELSNNCYLLIDDSYNLLKVDSIGNIQWKIPQISNAKIIINNDGKIMASYNNTNNNGDISLSSINDDGSFEWTKTFGGTGRESINKMFVLPSGGYYLIGTSSNLTGKWKRQIGVSDGDEYIYYIEESISSRYFIETDLQGNSCK